MAASAAAAAAGCPPCERFEQPSGQDLVGWGFWEFYEDTAEDSDEEEQEGDGTWFRFAVYAYEPHSSEGPYLVRATVRVAWSKQ